MPQFEGLCKAAAGLSSGTEDCWQQLLVDGSIGDFMPAHESPAVLRAGTSSCLLDQLWKKGGIGQPAQQLAAALLHSADPGACSSSRSAADGPSMFTRLLLVKVSPAKSPLQRVRCRECWQS